MNALEEHAPQRALDICLEFDIIERASWICVILGHVPDNYWTLRQNIVNRRHNQFTYFENSVNSIIRTYKKNQDWLSKFELFEIYDHAETKDLLEKYLVWNKGL